ncbi:MAG: penicillin-insensitive murein endopeptidase [Methylobacter sp.]|nr:penicillin-insensitive murein endopeptidase [Methylobacter sp.]
MKILISVLLLGISSACASYPASNKWAMVTQPVKAGEAQSIGAYTAGCLRGAVSLPPNGTGYQLMRLSRGRFYGHPDLIRFIERLGQTADTQRLGSLLIGDLGQPRGGPTLSGHRSHQTGLDVDIWYLFSPEAAIRNLRTDERETWSSPSVLAGKSDEINHGQWSLSQEIILEAAARMPEVERIFVNPSVKRLLCMRKTAHDWLRKIRPWWGHDDHFHVRLKCPANSNHCLGQEPLPESDGCDNSLTWWFSAEAKTPAKKQPVQTPVLPVLCDDVLKE